MTLFFLRKLLEDSRDGKSNLENPLREDPRLITVSQDQRVIHPQQSWKTEGSQEWQEKSGPIGDTIDEMLKQLKIRSNLVQFSSVTQSCLTLCDPMNCSMPGLPVHHQLLEFTQTHVHRVGDAIQPSHPLSSPFPPAPNPSQHQGLFQ